SASSEHINCGYSLSCWCWPTEFLFWRTLAALQKAYSVPWGCVHRRQAPRARLMGERPTEADAHSKIGRGRLSATSTPPPPHRTDTKKSEANQAEGGGFGHCRILNLDVIDYQCLQSAIGYATRTTIPHSYCVEATT